MNEKEERWESDYLNHIPFGYGCICNSENHLVLNLFMFKRMKVCFGTEFFEMLELLNMMIIIVIEIRVIDMVNYVIRRMNWYVNENG